MEREKGGSVKGRGSTWKRQVNPQERHKGQADHQRTIDSPAPQSRSASTFAADIPPDPDHDRDPEQEPLPDPSPEPNPDPEPGPVRTGNQSLFSAFQNKHTRNPPRPNVHVLL